MFQLTPAQQLQPGDMVEASVRFATYVGHPELAGQSLVVEEVQTFAGLNGPIVGIKLAGTNLMVHADAEAPIMAAPRLALGATVSWGTRGQQGVVVTTPAEGCVVVRQHLTARESIERVISVSALTVVA